MKIIVMTTQTVHHAYFLKELADQFPIALTMVETEACKPSFETHHPFEADRDRYEADLWFNGRCPELSDFSETVEYPSVNDKNAVSLMRSLIPDVVVVFGTGWIHSEMISTCPEGMVNLHGGDPERYRGLDSHLWAIYHLDFSALVTTLHRINEVLDDGDIVLQSELEIHRGTGIQGIRKVNTEACLKMAVTALEMYQRHGFFLTKKQIKKGRYYSFMPATLKEICVKNFNNIPKADRESS